MTGITQVNSIIKHDQKSQKSIEWWVSVWLQEPLRIIHLGSMCLYYKVMDHVGRLMSLQIDLRSSKEIRPELLESLDRCLVSTLVLVFLTYISYHPSSFSSRQGCLVIPRNDKGLVAIINLYGWSLLRPGQVALKAATCTYSRRIQDGKSETHSEHNTCWHITILPATQIRCPAIVKWWSHEPEFEVWDIFGIWKCSKWTVMMGFTGAKTFLGPVHTCSVSWNQCVDDSNFLNNMQDQQHVCCLKHDSITIAWLSLIVAGIYSKTLKMWTASVYESKMNST